MALSLRSIQKEDTTVAFTSDRRLYLTADRSVVVEEGDPSAAYLLVGKGGEVSTAAARQYGLKDPAKQPDTAERPDDAETKTVKPTANKAVVPADDKAVAPKADK